MNFFQSLVLSKVLLLAILDLWKLPKIKKIRLELCVVNIRTNIFIYVIDEKQSKFAPDWFKTEKFTAILSEKFNSKHWKSSEN